MHSSGHAQLTLSPTNDFDKFTKATVEVDKSTMQLAATVQKKFVPAVHDFGAYKTLVSCGKPFLLFVLILSSRVLLPCDL